MQSWLSHRSSLNRTRPRVNVAAPTVRRDEVAPRVITLRRIRSAFKVATVLIGVGWLALMVYIWAWTLPQWGVGWALVGTMNITFAALLALAFVWLLERTLRRFAKPS